MDQNEDPSTSESMYSNGIIDKLQETEHRVDVRWKVGRLLDKSGLFDSISSNVFKWASHCWYLRMNFTDTEIELILYKSMSANPMDTVFRCGIELTDGTSEMRGYLIQQLDWTEDRFGIKEFIQLSELKERKNELLPNDYLTILCSVGHRISSIKPDTIKFKDDMSTSPPIISSRIWRNFLESNGKREILSESLDLLSSLENLSQDLRNALVNIKPDITLTCGTLSYSAHKLILAARSKVFADEFRVRPYPTLAIYDIDPSVFEEFLIFLYCGRINLLEGTVLKLYQAGEIYAVYTLKKLCANFMIQNLRVDNFLTFLTFANSIEDKEYRNAVISAIAKNARILKSEAWFAFSESQPVLANDVYRAYFRK